MSKIFNLQFSIFNRINSFWRKPQVVIVTSEGRKTTNEAVNNTLKRYFKIGKEILIFETDLKSSQELEKLKSLIKKSYLPVIIVTNTSEISKDSIFFRGNQDKIFLARELVKNLPANGYLILNADDESLRQLENDCLGKILTFGFSERADFIASDLKINDETNFKINYKGNSVPLWLERSDGKEKVYAALAAAAVGTVNNLNLVEISQSFKKPA